MSIIIDELCRIKNEYKDKALKADEKLLEIYREVFTAFSTLSDAQELISLERNKEAIDMINHAKSHLNKIATASDEDMKLYSVAMETIPFVCGF